jgi:hypothetical protein
VSEARIAPFRFANEVEMRRAVAGLLLLLTLAVGACASDDAELQRRGGPLPDAMEDPPEAAAGAAGVGGGGVPFCAALEVIRAKCQRCHSDPPQNGAPVPFLTYEDTQASYFDTDRKWSEMMLNAVTKGFMPFVRLNDPPTSLMPPVQPLTDEEKATLLDWLEQGALPEGGTDCP